MSLSQEAVARLPPGTHLALRNVSEKDKQCKDSVLVRVAQRDAGHKAINYDFQDLGGGMMRGVGFTSSSSKAALQSLEAGRSFVLSNFEVLYITLSYGAASAFKTEIVIRQMTTVKPAPEGCQVPLRLKPKFHKLSHETFSKGLWANLAFAVVAVHGESSYINVTVVDEAGDSATMGFTVSNDCPGMSAAAEWLNQPVDCSSPATYVVTYLKLDSNDGLMPTRRSVMAPLLSDQGGIEASIHHSCVSAAKLWLNKNAEVKRFTGVLRFDDNVSQVPFSVTCGACHMQSHQPVVPGATCSICTREGNSLVIVKSLKGTLHKDDGEVVDQVRIPSKFVDSVLARDPVQLYTNDPDDMELLLHKLEVTGTFGLAGTMLSEMGELSRTPVKLLWDTKRHKPDMVPATPTKPVAASRGGSNASSLGPLGDHLKTA